MEMNQKDDRLYWWPYLIDDIRALASPYETQKKSFPPFCGVDELALEFNEHAEWLNLYIQNGLISAEHAERVKEMDDHFSVLTDDKTLWNLEALEHRPEWEEIRINAMRLLEDMKIPYKEPTVSIRTSYHCWTKIKPTI